MLSARAHWPVVAVRSQRRAAAARLGRITALLVLLASVSTAAPASEPVAVSGRAMGTTWVVKFVQPVQPLRPPEIERLVADRLEELEQLFSTYRPQSALSRFNATRGTEWFAVAPELARVAAESRRISELTGGAFDATVNPLVQLWGFGSTRRSGTIPTTAEIDAVRARVDWQRLEVRLDPPALRKSDPHLTADFSSLAKGFAADSVTELLLVAGASNHLILVGGDVKAAGAGPDGKGWSVAIERPAADATGTAQIVRLKDQALSASGDYRNFLMVGGRRYGHIIDPRRGEPVSGELAAVSVVHTSCATSSALATALFVLGAEEGHRLAVRERLAALFQVRSGVTIEARATPEFERQRKRSAFE